MANSNYLEFSTDTYEVEEFDTEEGKQYMIYGNTVLTEDGKAIGKRKVEKSRRDAEKDMLKSLAEYAANSAKKFTDAMLMADVMGQLDNLADEQQRLELDKRDIESLVKAFEDMAGKRPNAWIKYCRAMLDQLSNPPKIEEPKAESKKE